VRPAAVCSVVLDGTGRVLLQRRRDNGEWALPGGGIELDETAADAVVREIEEETGARAEVVRLIGVYSDPARTTVSYPDGNVVQYVSVCFECRVVGGELRPTDEATESRWFEPGEAGEVIWSIHVDRLANGLAGATSVYT
jgi:ADP-ribose pyrophosphatase YjhB (NUDIX family)